MSDAPSVGPGREERRRVRAAFLDLLAERSPGKTFCPSEVARRVFPAGEWRGQMGVVREVGHGMVEEGILVARQRGQVVAPGTARGPIRYGRA